MRSPKKNYIYICILKSEKVPTSGSEILYVYYIILLAHYVIHCQTKIFRPPYFLIFFNYRQIMFKSCNLSSMMPETALLKFEKS